MGGKPNLSTLQQTLTSAPHAINILEVSARLRQGDHGILIVGLRREQRITGWNLSRANFPGMGSFCAHITWLGLLSNDGRWENVKGILKQAIQLFFLRSPTGGWKSRQKPLGPAVKIFLRKGLRETAISHCEVCRIEKPL